MLVGSRMGTGPDGCSALRGRDDLSSPDAVRCGTDAAILLPEGEIPGLPVGHSGP